MTKPPTVYKCTIKSVWQFKSHSSAKLKPTNPRKLRLMVHSCIFAVSKQYPKTPKCMNSPSVLVLPRQSGIWPQRRDPVCSTFTMLKQNWCLKEIQWAAFAVHFEHILKEELLTYSILAPFHAGFHLYLLFMSCCLTADNLPGKIMPGIITEMDTNIALKHSKLNLLKCPFTCFFSFSSSEGLLDMTLNNLSSQSQDCQGFTANASPHHQAIYT